MKKLILLLAITGISFADDINLKQNAMAKIESMFNETQNTMIVVSGAKVQLPNYVSISINSQFLVNIHSSESIIVNRIGVTIDDTSVSNNVGLNIKAQDTAKYLFNSGDLVKAMGFTKGYTLLGIYQQITADQFLGYSEYYYKKVIVSISWTDNKKNYEQSNLNMMLLMAR